jgi:hypothetical protein
MLINIALYKNLETKGEMVPRNFTEVKYGANYYSCHTALDTCCCEV